MPRNRRAFEIPFKGIRVSFLPFHGACSPCRLADVVSYRLASENGTRWTRKWNLALQLSAITGSGDSGARPKDRISARRRIHECIGSRQIVTHAFAFPPEDVGVVNPRPSSAGGRALRTEFGGGGEDPRKKVSVAQVGRRERRAAWSAPRKDLQFHEGRGEGGVGGREDKARILDADPGHSCGPSHSVAPLIRNEKTRKTPRAHSCCEHSAAEIPFHLCTINARSLRPRCVPDTYPLPSFLSSETLRSCPLHHRITYRKSFRTELPYLRRVFIVGCFNVLINVARLFFCSR